MKNIRALLLVFLALQFVGCAPRAPKPTGELEGIGKIDIDQTHRTKTIHLNRKFYVGAIGAHGLVDWVTYGYNFPVPLGRVRHVMNPHLTGPDIDGETFGYIAFNEDRHEIIIRMHLVVYPEGASYDESHGGGFESMRLIGERDCPINGTYHTDDPDAFK